MADDPSVRAAGLWVNSRLETSSCKVGREVQATAGGQPIDSARGENYDCRVQRALFVPGECMATRPSQCPHCGMAVSNRMTQCPYCREAIPEIRVSKRHNPAGRKKIRQGLLYMLLAGVAYYFAGGYSGWQLPITIQPMVTTYLIPLLFFGGLGLSLYGLYVHIMS